MTPTDVGIFELLAAAFTLTFIALVFFIWRFIRGLDQARNGGPGRRPRFSRLPALKDLERGAVQFRVRGNAAPTQDESISPTGR
jgi:hypothetical protein